MTPALLAVALLWLAPHLGEPTALRYAAVVSREANQHLLDPLLVLAYVQGESQWRARLVSRTHDHGLGQVHVSETTNHELMGQQDALLHPEYNLAVTASMMRMWRDHHGARCKCHPAVALLPGELRRPWCHHWLEHMKWGRIVRWRGADGPMRALAEYARLRARFAPRRGRGGEA